MAADMATVPADLTARVLIVGEVRLVCEGLARVLIAESEVEVLGTAAVSEAIALLASLRPNVVLADAAVVRSTALVTAAEDAGARVVVIGVAEEDEAAVVVCAGSGVAGFVGREAGLDELVRALEAATRGEVQCSARAAAAVFRRLTARG